jgi:hypothetical protein
MDGDFSLVTFGYREFCVFGTFFRHQIVFLLFELIVLILAVSDIRSISMSDTNIKYLVYKPLQTSQNKKKILYINCALLMSDNF